ncbi:MAG: hypothetical protein EBV19_07190 [Flavobacteriia bacterium]|nr:hypothetical protein [Flavobacteriia bacterium]
MGPATKFLGIASLQTDKKYSHVLICDDDIVVRKDAYMKLYTTSQKNPSIIWANMCYDHKKYMSIAGFAGILIPWRSIQLMIKHPNTLRVMDGLRSTNHACYNTDDETH